MLSNKNSIHIVTIAALIFLSGCQMEYAPLKTTEPVLELRALDGNMADHWQSEIEPIIQNQCLQCHSIGNSKQTGLELENIPLSNQHANLIQLLNIYKEHSTIELSTTDHSSLNSEAKNLFTEFESYAALYWNWQEQITLAEKTANYFFESNLEDIIIQPVCTGCHVFLGEDDSFAGGLSFYTHQEENHGRLNSQQAMTFLIDQSNAELLYSKATGINHGGATVIRPNTVYSDALMQHSNLTNDVIQLIDTQPY